MALKTIDGNEKKTRRKFSSFDFRFEISTKNSIRITLHPDAVFFFKISFAQAERPGYASNKLSVMSQHASY